MGHDAHHGGFHGPKCWVVSLLAGLLLGFVISLIAPAHYKDHSEPTGSHSLANAPGEEAGHGSPAGAPIALGSDDADPLDPAPTLLPSGAEPPHDTPVHEGPIADPGHAPDAIHDEAHDHHGPKPVVPLWLVTPFALLLLSIAIMPFISARVWHQHFPDFAFFLGGIVLSYYLFAFSKEYTHGLSYGQYNMWHIALEYYAFIALVGGLYVASGGVLVDVKGQGRPGLNTAILAFGAVFANIVGTTGASVLLIRPFMRINKGRLTPLHVVFFIFIVSNCGGCLTPIGDPPLYLGYLKGVPFEWTLLNLWGEWATVNALLLTLFFLVDKRIGPGPNASLEPAGKTRIAIKGTSGMICLALIVGGVFIDPMLKGTGLAGLPIGATFQLAVAITAYRIANREILRANEFTFFPVKEVGLLFVGIFTTMAPALAYLSEHGAEFGLDSPTKFYFATGFLSGVLDNAPTYLNFLQVAFAAHNPPLELTAENVHTFIAEPVGRGELAAISCGAVFFGAMTYIGNGPNFMVKSIADASGLRMPSFFGYIKYAIIFLLPILVLAWSIWIR